MPSLDQLETFLWLATLGSFRKTAMHLNTTQPAVSSRIASLEAQLGLRLFERDTRSVSLTSRGQELLPYAEKVLRAMSGFRERAGSRSRVSGILRLGVSETIVHTWLPSFLGRLHENYPEVDAEIMVDVTDNLRVNLVERSINLAFLAGPISESGIENVPLSRFPVTWAASPRLGIDARKPITVEQLVRYRLLTHARNTRPFVEVSKFLMERSEAPARIVPSNSLATCLYMTVTGIGIGTLPRQMIADKLDGGALIEIDCGWRPSDMVYTASFPSKPFDPIVEIAVTLARQVASESAASRGASRRPEPRRRGGGSDRTDGARPSASTEAQPDGRRASRRRRKAATPRRPPAAP